MPWSCADGDATFRRRQAASGFAMALSVVTPASPAIALGAAIAHSPLGVALRESAWLYPTVESLHVVGLALLVGSIFVVDLRLVGIGRNVPLKALLAFVLPVTLSCLLLVVPTGLLLFIAHASDLIGNRAFLVKLTLLFAAAINALMFHVGPYRQAIDQAPGAASGAATRASAIASMGLWIAVIIAGRMIAYA